MSRYNFPDRESPRCIILAAGASNRLRPLTDSMPKCLLKIGDKRILERTIENVLDAGIKDISIVIGYQADMIRDFVGRQFPKFQFQLITNSEYSKTNNSYSLWLALRFLKDRQDGLHNGLLLMDSDILFSSKLLSFFLNIKEKDKISIRRTGEHNDEEILVTVNVEGNIVLIGKGISISEAYGESIGIESFSEETIKPLFEILDRRVQNEKGRNEFYESSFQEMIDKGTNVKAIDISNFPVIEIDTPGDLDKARQLKIG